VRPAARKWRFTPLSAARARACRWTSPGASALPPPRTLRARRDAADRPPSRARQRRSGDRWSTCPPKGLEPSRWSSSPSPAPAPDEVVWGHGRPRRRPSTPAPPSCSSTPAARTTPRRLSVLVGDGAQLTAVRSTGLGRRRRAPRRARGHPGRPRRPVRSTSVTYGGSLVRVNETVDYTGPAATPSCSGCTSPTTASTSSTGSSSTTTPRTAAATSLQGRAAGGGRAHRLDRRRADPQGRRRHRHLRAQPQPACSPRGCRADSVPNLEIETGEIEGAGHASATGRFDDEQLFYLQSRGIDARRGPAPGRARVLRRGHRADRRPGRSRAADGRGRAGAQDRLRRVEDSA
jgi:Fe-S cluster assembly protein SufD